MSIELVTPPAEEPITVEEARMAARITDTSEDALIAGMIKAARGMGENEIAGKMIEQTWDVWLDAFPAAEIRIPAPLRPLRSVTSVTYLDASGVEQTVSATDYTVDARQPLGWVIPDAGFSWPSTWDGANAVRVRVVVGMAADAANVDEALKLWIKAMVAFWFDNRAAAAERQMHSAPFIGGLLDRFRLVTF